jgi:hypothetical protein
VKSVELSLTVFSFLFPPQLILSSFLPGRWFVRIWFLVRPPVCRWLGRFGRRRRHRPSGLHHPIAIPVPQLWTSHNKIQSSMQLFASASRCSVGPFESPRAVNAAHTSSRYSSVISLGLLSCMAALRRVCSLRSYSHRVWLLGNALDRGRKDDCRWLDGQMMFVNWSYWKLVIFALSSFFLLWKKIVVKSSRTLKHCSCHD